MSDTTRRSKRAAIAAVAVGSAAAPAILAAPATANNKVNCNDHGGDICLWEDGGFNSLFGYKSGSFTDLDYRNDYYVCYCDTLNDTISAVWNNSNRWVKFFRNPNASGATLCLGPGMAVSDLTTLGIPGEPQNNWSNRISGHATYGGQPAGCNTVINDSNHRGCSM